MELAWLSGNFFFWTGADTTADGTSIASSLGAGILSMKMPVEVAVTVAALWFGAWCRSEPAGVVSVVLMALALDICAATVILSTISSVAVYMGGHSLGHQSDWWTVVPAGLAIFIATSGKWLWDEWKPVAGQNGVIVRRSVCATFLFISVINLCAASELAAHCALA